MTRKELANKLACEVHKKMGEIFIEAVQYEDIETGDGEDFMDAVAEIDEEFRGILAKKLTGEIE